MMNLCFLNVLVYYDDEHEYISILDNCFFDSKINAISYAKEYLKKESEIIGCNLLAHMKVDDHYGTIDVYDDSINYSIKVCTIEQESLKRILNHFNEQNKDIYYITYFSTLYYIKDNIVIEPDEMKYKQVLKNMFFSNYDEALKYIIHCINCEDKNSKLYLLKEEDTYKLYGIYNNELGFECHYIINSMPKTCFNDFFKSGKDKKEKSVETLFLSRDVNEIKKLLSKHSDINVYRLLGNCRDQFELWY